MSMQWEAYTCDELAKEAGSGSDAAFSELMLRLSPEIRRQAAQYSLPGLDRDDLVQEGLLGVMNAVRHFQPERGDFFPFAVRCARSGMVTAARRALCGKHTPLRDYSPLEHSGETPADPQLQPEELLAGREHARELQSWLKRELSPFEREVLRYYLAGRSYPEIASLLSSHSKAVDNALQRVRRKLRRFYSTHPVSA